MKSMPKRTVSLRSRKTSISVEDEFWYALKEIARDRKSTLSALISSIDEHREFGNLSSAIRLFVLRFYQEKALSYQDQLTLADLHDGKF